MNFVVCCFLWGSLQMELFNQSQKQIFIALDKVNHYSEDLTIPSIIENILSQEILKFLHSSNKSETIDIISVKTEYL